MMELYYASFCDFPSTKFESIRQVVRALELPPEYIISVRIGDTYAHMIVQSANDIQTHLLGVNWSYSYLQRRVLQIVQDTLSI